MTKSCRATECGVMSVLVLALVACAVGMGVLVAAVARIYSAHVRLTTAADAAALAAAGAVVEGRGCAAAHVEAVRLAARNGAQVRALVCFATGARVEVEAHVDLPGQPVIRASARAVGDAPVATDVGRAR
jgi:hypothetical protein